MHVFTEPLRLISYDMKFILFYLNIQEDISFILAVITTTYSLFITMH